MIFAYVFFSCAGRGRGEENLVCKQPEMIRLDFWLFISFSGVKGKMIVITIVKASRRWLSSIN